MTRKITLQKQIFSQPLNAFSTLNRLSRDRSVYTTKIAVSRASLEYRPAPREAWGYNFRRLYRMKRVEEFIDFAIARNIQSLIRILEIFRRNQTNLLDRLYSDDSTLIYPSVCTSAVNSRRYSLLLPTRCKIAILRMSSYISESKSHVCVWAVWVCKSVLRDSELLLGKFHILQ